MRDTLDDEFRDYIDSVWHIQGRMNTDMLTKVYCIRN